MTTDDIDLWRAANLLVDRYGDGATIAAQGDTAGKVVWLRILEEVEELQNTKPAGPVH